MRVTINHVSRHGRVLRWFGVAAGLVTAAAVMAPPTSAAPQATRNTWVQVAPTPEGRDGAAAATGLDGTVYAISGLSPNRSGAVPVGTNEAYSPTHDTWTERAPIPTPRQCLAAASGTDGRIYVLGGEDRFGVTLAAAEAYNPLSDTWTELPALQQDRGCPAAASDSQGRIYAIGGLQHDAANGFNSISLATVERYDPTTNSWSFVASMPIGLDSAGAATGPDGRIYVIGGDTSTCCSFGPSNVVYAYDPNTDSWATLAAMTPTDRYRFVQVVAGPDGRIYAIGGYTKPFDRSVPEAHLVQAYTPATNSWASVPSTIDPCIGCAAASSSGRVYTIGGLDSSFNHQTAVDAYTPAKLSTTSLASSANPSASGAIVTLTATVAPGSVSGTVTFIDGSAVLGTAQIGTGTGGIATLSTSALTVGAHSLTAVYSGDAVYGGSTSLTVNQVVQ